MSSELDKFLQEKRKNREEGKEFHGFSLQQIVIIALVVTTVLYLL